MGHSGEGFFGGAVHSCGLGRPGAPISLILAWMSVGGWEAGRGGGRLHWQGLYAEVPGRGVNGAQGQQCSQEQAFSLQVGPQLRPQVSALPQPAGWALRAWLSFSWACHVLAHFIPRAENVSFSSRLEMLWKPRDFTPQKQTSGFF